MSICYLFGSFFHHSGNTTLKFTINYFSLKYHFNFEKLDEVLNKRKMRVTTFCKLFVQNKINKYINWNNTYMKSHINSVGNMQQQFIQSIYKKEKTCFCKAKCISVLVTSDNSIKLLFAISHLNFYETLVFSWNF